MITVLHFVRPSGQQAVRNGQKCHSDEKDANAKDAMYYGCEMWHILIIEPQLGTMEVKSVKSVKYFVIH